MGTKPIGRKNYTQQEKEIAIDTICERMIDGESIRNIMKDTDLPKFSTFVKWVGEDTKKLEHYARAMQIRAEVLFEKLLEIAYDDSEDEIIDEITGKRRINNEFVQRSRLKIDTLKFIIAKLAPKKYGEKSSIDITSGGEKIEVPAVQNWILSKKKDVESEEE